MSHPLVKLVATGVLAGIAGAILAAIAADLLDLSPFIAGGVAGVLMAVIVVLLLYRQRPVPPA